jgi:hypothetical protein
MVGRHIFHRKQLLFSAGKSVFVKVSGLSLSQGFWTNFFPSKAAKIRVSLLLLPSIEAQIVLSLYVGVRVLELPKDCKWGRLLFLVATFFCVCFGVGSAFSSTRGAWFHVEAVSVCM